MPESRFDDWIDQRLRNVPLPPNLLERLSQAGPNQGANDAQLDAALCEVAVPAELEVRLRSIPRRSSLVVRRRSAWRRYAMAASLFLAIGLGAVGFLGLVTGAFVPGEPQVAKSKPGAPQTAAPRSELPIAAPTVTDRSDRMAKRRPAGDAEKKQPVASESAELAAQPPADPPTNPQGADIASAKSPRAPALGADATLARLPDLDVFASEPLHGMSPPLVKGYDLLFELKRGEHPFVSPAEHQSLAQTKLPFTFRTESYDEALASVRSGQVPSADEIRIEDFLAAQDYDLPAAPPAGLALQVAAGKSPLEATAATRAAAHGDSLHWLTLVVQGASYDMHRHRPQRLIVMVDTSAFMKSQARMAGVKRALMKLSRHMDQSDRITLVRFSESTSVVTEDANREELAALAESGSLSTTSGVANLSTAIEAVSKIARDMQAADPRRVVILASTPGNYDPAELPKSAELLSELAKANIPWRIVRLHADANDTHWDQLAAQAQGKVVAAESPDDVYQEMYEALTGWPVKVARNVSVTLRFNPQSVASYRLLGHAASTLTGLSPDPLEIDLGADQTATGVYEIALKPERVETVGSIEVVWTHPSSGQAGRIVRPIQRQQLSESFFASPNWFQQAVIAAEGAEALRGSSYLPTNRPVAGILDVASRVDASLAQQPDFSMLVDLLKQADAAR